MDIMPWHTRCLQDGHLVADELVDLLEIKETSVVIILPWEKGAFKVGWVHIGEGAIWDILIGRNRKVSIPVLVMGIPAAEAEIKTTNGCA